jgi:hypothetical protein
MLHASFGLQMQVVKRFMQRVAACQFSTMPLLLCMQLLT